MSTIYSVPRNKRHSKYKKVLYLEPPFDGAVTVKRRVTTIVPPPQPPPPPPAPIPFLPEPMPMPMPMPEPVPTRAPSIIDASPPPVLHLPPASVMEPEEPESPIDVIAVDVDPSDAGSSKSSRTSKSYKSSSRSSRHGSSRSRDREVFIERERVVPVPVRVPVPYPVQTEPHYDTFRYVEAPRRYEPRRRSIDHEVIIEDHHRRRYIRDY